MEIPFFKPSIDTAQCLRRLEDVLDSGHLVYGSQAAGLELDVTTFLDTQSQALATVDCRSGLHLFLEVNDVRGKYVIIPDNTYTATAQAVMYAGAAPILAPVNQYGFLELETVKRIYTDPKYDRRVAGVIYVHYAGIVNVELDDFCDMEEDLFLVEDAAHAFTSRWPCGDFVGKYGNVAYSFYANKTVTTGEGGMILTRHRKHYEEMCIRASDGMLRSNITPCHYEIVRLGYKYRMSDVHAAIGRVQLGLAMEHRTRRAEIAHKYAEGLKGLKNVHVFSPDDDIKNLYVQGSSWHLYPVRLLKGYTGDLIKELDTNYHISCSKHYKPLSEHLYWEKYAHDAGDYPHESFSLPIYPSMTDNEVDYVISSVREVLL